MNPFTFVRDWVERRRAAREAKRIYLAELQQCIDDHHNCQSRLIGLQDRPTLDSLEGRWDEPAEEIIRRLRDCQPMNECGQLQARALDDWVEDAKTHLSDPEYRRLWFGEWDSSDK